MSSLGLSGNSGSSAGTSSSFSLQGTKEFLQSNSLVAKFAFCCVIIGRVRTPSGTRPERCN